MDLITLKDAEKAYQNSATIKEWFKNFSIFVWNKIGYTRANKLKIYETTVTQELVFRLCLAMDKHSGWGIEMYESRDENANGNDLEIIIKTMCGYLKLPCQAKIIYNTARTDNYKAIKHPVKIKDSTGSVIEDEQINTLLNYADKIGGIPIYLFYNFCGNKKKLKELQGKVITGFDIASLGCSFAYANEIKARYNKIDSLTGKTLWKIPTFENMHPEIANPLYFLLQFANLTCAMSKGIILPYRIPFKFHSTQEIQSENQNWKYVLERDNQKDDLTDDPYKKYTLKKSDKNTDSRPFNPAHRIILNSNDYFNEI